jgi:hypothetical protein
LVENLLAQEKDVKSGYTAAEKADFKREREETEKRMSEIS